MLSKLTVGVFALVAQLYICNPDCPEFGVERTQDLAGVICPGIGLLYRVPVLEKTRT